MAMDILLALTPSLFLGPLGILLAKIGGTVRQQTLGEMLGALLVASLALPFLAPNWTTTSFLVPFIGGITCAIGIAMQLYSFRVVGVSRTMPISTGLQIMITGLAGVVIFNEWATPSATLLGVVAMLIIIAGIALTSFSEQATGGAALDVDEAEAGQAGASAKVVDKAAMRRGLVINVVSAFLLCGYMVWLRWEDINYTEFIFPLALGMAVGAALVAIFLRDGKPLFNATLVKLLVPGVMFGIGVMLMQIANQRVGVAAGFTLSQVGVVISVFGGIVWLKERKTPTELRASILGVLLVLVGAAIIGYTKTLS